MKKAPTAEVNLRELDEGGNEDRESIASGSSVYADREGRLWEQGTVV